MMWRHWPRSMSQKRNDSSLEPVTNSPCQTTAREIAAVCPDSVNKHAKSGAVDHTRTVLSRLPEQRHCWRPGWPHTARQHTGAVCPVSSPIHLPLSTFQTRIVVSEEPEVRQPVGH